VNKLRRSATSEFLVVAFTFGEWRIVAAVLQRESRRTAVYVMPCLPNPVVPGIRGAR
jgi:hypothetical protein